MHPETKFARKVDAELKKLSNSHWFNIQQSSIRGTPDRIGVVNGTFVALELKVSEKSTRAKLQTYHINRINEANGYGYFVYPSNLTDVLMELKELNGVFK